MFIVQNYGLRVSVYDTRKTIFCNDIKTKIPALFRTGIYSI